MEWRQEGSGLDVLGTVAITGPPTVLVYAPGARVPLTMLGCSERGGGIC